MPAGSIRRWRETTGDIDVLVSSGNAATVIEAFTRLEQVKQVLGAGETRASVLTVGDGESADIGLPRQAPESLAPILAVVRGQQLAYELALRLGHDPDSPSGLTKVTAT